MPAPLSRAFEYVANLSGYQFSTPNMSLFEGQATPQKPKEMVVPK